MSEQPMSIGQAMDQETTQRLAQQLGQGVINQTRVQVELEFAQGQVRALQAKVAELTPVEQPDKPDLFQGDSK